MCVEGGTHPNRDVNLHVENAVDYLLLALEIFQLLALAIGALFLQKYLPSYVASGRDDITSIDLRLQITRSISNTASQGQRLR